VRGSILSAGGAWRRTNTYHAALEDGAHLWRAISALHAAYGSALGTGATLPAALVAWPSPLGMEEAGGSGEAICAMFVHRGALDSMWL
jgi:hypothetical protein